MFVDNTTLVPGDAAARVGKVDQLIEESLDSFDFFKVTNLGRINNDPARKKENE